MTPHAIENCVLPSAMLFAGVVGLKFDAAGGEGADFVCNMARSVVRYTLHVKLDLTLRLWKCGDSGSQRRKSARRAKSRKGESSSY
jgi:hypothetical protein